MLNLINPVFDDRKLVDSTLKEFGKLDILVNNASMQEDLQDSFIGMVLQLIYLTHLKCQPAVTNISLRHSSAPISSETGHVSPGERELENANIYKYCAYIWPITSMSTEYSL